MMRYLRWAVDLFVTNPTPECGVLEGQDIPGHDMDGGFLGGSQADCCHRCLATTGCQAAVYIGADTNQAYISSCWIKDTNQSSYPTPVNGKFRFRC